MGRISDFFARLEKKVDKPADPELLLTNDDASAGDDAGEDGDAAKERAAKVRRQRRAHSMRWGDR